MKQKIIKNNFFKNNPEFVAKNLLGKVIVRKIKNREIKILILETEAYLGENDLASHAHFGKTERNKAMFEDGGIWYVYLVYGIHWLLNIVTEKQDKPSAVLIRRGLSLNKTKKILNGPAIVARTLKIDGKFYGKKSLRESGLWIEDWGIDLKKIKIRKLTRVGVDYAGRWADKKLRFNLDNLEELAIF